MSLHADDSRYTEFVQGHYRRLLRRRLLALTGQFLVPLPIYLPEPMGALVLTRATDVHVYLRSVADYCADYDVRFFDVSIGCLERGQGSNVIVPIEGAAVTGSGGTSPLAYRSTYFTTLVHGLIRVEMVDFSWIEPISAVIDVQNRFVEGVLARHRAPVAAQP